MRRTKRCSVLVTSSRTVLNCFARTLYSLQRIGGLPTTVNLLVLSERALPHQQRLLCAGPSTRKHKVDHVVEFVFHKLFNYSTNRSI